MSQHQFSGGNIRKLWPTETDKLRDHLLRLDKMSRRLRFAHGVSDAFIEDYAGRTAEMGALVYAYFDGGEVRAAAELKKLGDVWGREAEAAFSVELTLQDQAIGSVLRGLVIRAARNRGVQHLCVSCLAENGKMRAIARKYEAELRLEYGEVVVEIGPDRANYFSLLAEAVEDRFGYTQAVIDLQSRVLKAA